MEKRRNGCLAGDGLSSVQVKCQCGDLHEHLKWDDGFKLPRELRPLIAGESVSFELGLLEESSSLTTENGRCLEKEITEGRIINIRAQITLRDCNVR